MHLKKKKHPSHLKCRHHVDNDTCVATFLHRQPKSNEQGFFFLESAIIVLLELKWETIDTTIVAVVECIQEVSLLDQEETTLSTKKAKCRHICTLTESFKYLSQFSLWKLIGLKYFWIHCFGSHHFHTTCSDQTNQTKTWRSLDSWIFNCPHRLGEQKSFCITVMMNSA